jgi:CRP-like cAMP-binding protein/Fe-S-cluster-containing hydrogenase component 2
VTDTPIAAGMEQDLLKMPLFAKLKPKTFQALVEGLRFDTKPAGAVLVRQGEYAEDFYVLLEGIATGYRSHQDGTSEIVGTHGAQDWFGEMTALSHQPQYATVKAERPCVMIVLDAPLFQKIYKSGGSFAELVDARYRERSLAAHLRIAPLFKNLDRRKLRSVAKEVSFKTYEEGAVIAAAGAPAEGVYLVRSGIVKRVAKTAGGDEDVQAYLCDNSSFGERTLTDQPAWPCSYVAMTRTDVVFVPRALVERLAGDAAERTKMTALARTLAAQETGTQSTLRSASDGLAQDELLELMVGKEAVKGGEALVIDMNRCTRCNACVESCVAVHEDGVPRLSKRGIRAGDLMLSSACFNCKIPECMLGCNYGAIRRNADGQISFVLDNCTGCSACETKCPYGVIRMADFLDPATEAASAKSFLAKLPVIGKWFEKKVAPIEPAPDAVAPAAKKKEQKAIKCDLCAGLPFEACLYNCPCNAISRVSPEELARRSAFVG